MAGRRWVCVSSRPPFHLLQMNSILKRALLGALVLSAPSCRAQSPAGTGVSIETEVAPREGVRVDCDSQMVASAAFRITVIIDSASMGSRGSVLLRFAPRPNEPGIVYEAVSFRAQLSPLGQAFGVSCPKLSGAIVHGLSRNLSQLLITTDAPGSLQLRIRDHTGAIIREDMPVPRTTSVYRLDWALEGPR